MAFFQFALGFSDLLDTAACADAENSFIPGNNHSLAFMCQGKSVEVNENIL